MRWGVRDEATDDHMTTELCMKEIENCQRLSMGPNFVVCSNYDFVQSKKRFCIREKKEKRFLEVMFKTKRL